MQCHDCILIKTIQPIHWHVAGDHQPVIFSEKTRAGTHTFACFYYAHRFQRIIYFVSMKASSWRVVVLVADALLFRESEYVRLLIKRCSCIIHIYKPNETYNNDLSIVPAISGPTRPDPSTHAHPWLAVNCFRVGIGALNYTFLCINQRARRTPRRILDAGQSASFLTVFDGILDAGSMPCTWPDQSLIWIE